MTIESVPPATRRVAVVADTDSRWKWGVQLAARLGPGRPVDCYQLSFCEPPSPRQLAEAGVVPARLQVVTAAALITALAETTPDVLVLSLPGGGVQSVLQLVAEAGLPRRPLLVTGYVGVVYERVVDGLLLRAGADLIAVNSPADQDRFRAALANVGVDPGCLVRTRLPYLGDPGDHGTNGRFTVTFAGQPGVPGPRQHRRKLVERLAGHARLHPERDVVVKLRSLPGERVTHAEPYPYDGLLAGLGVDQPKNLTVATGDMGTALDYTDLLVTVSSTAAVEAIHRGIPTAVLTDFGIREALGNAHFLGSGCLASFDELDEGAAPVADPEWARRNGLGESSDELPGRVDALLAAGPLPPLRPFYSARNVSVMLPGLLAGYGVAPDGRPLVAEEVRPGLIRSFVRKSARAAYRHGVDVVAPTLRKLAAR